MNSSKVRLYRSRAAALLFFLLAGSHIPAYAQHRSRSYVEIFTGTDTNVLRDTTGRSADNTVQAFFHRAALFKRKRSRLRTQYTVSGGVTAYGRFSEENRTALHGTLLLVLPFSGNTEASVKTAAKVKYYFSGIHYETLDAAESVTFFPWAGLSVSAWAVQTRFFVQPDSYFSYTDLCCGADITYKLSRKCSFSLRPHISYRRFNRNAFMYMQSQWGEDVWTEDTQPQKDTGAGIEIRARFFYWALVDLSLSAVSNRSNSFGYSYTRPGVRITAARAVSPSITLTVRGEVRKKNYTESLLPLFQIRPSTEHDENTFVYMDLCKDFSGKQSLRMRMGIYKNESPFRQRYYEKTVITVGYSRRF